MTKKKFKFWSRTFCHLCNVSTWLLAAEKGTLLSARNCKNLAKKCVNKITVAVSYYSHSLTSRTKNHTWKNSSPLEATSVISIPNTIVSSILLSSTGELQSWSTRALQRQRTWRRWMLWTWTWLVCISYLLYFYGLSHDILLIWTLI